MTADATQQFAAAMAARGIIPPSEIQADGQIHRCNVAGRNGVNDASYLLHIDGIPAGGFENWKDGLGWQNWKADIGRSITPAEEAALRAKVQEAQKVREAEQVKRRGEAREQACLIWAEAQPCAKHEYLERKSIKAHSTRLHQGKLVIPMHDIDGLLHSLQTIGPDGSKRFLPGGKKRGCFFMLGKPARIVCICEGYATGASIFEATGHAVAVAFDSGNLKHVAMALKEKYPAAKLLICADDDYQTEGNPGITHAREAAQAVGGIVAIPDFGENRPGEVTDFNDLHQHMGLGVVLNCIASAISRADGADVSSVQTNLSDDKIVANLASLNPLKYDRIRKSEAKRLDVRPETLDRVVAAARRNRTEDMGFQDIEKWPDPINPAQLLTNISETVSRFIVCEKEIANSVALWAAMTWFMDVVHVAPLAVITAPEKRCGKTQLLNMLSKLSYRPLSASSISPAALYRCIEAWKPTLLLDETDAFLKENEELRGVINSGHTRDSAYVIRTVGDDHTPKLFSTWGAKALSGIGHLSDTLMDRSIVFELRRKLGHESVERIRHAEPDLFVTLSRKLARFSDDHREAVRLSRPTLPEELNDRAQDNWEPLLAIADVVGNNWPALARNAAIKLSGTETESQSSTIGVELLSDIKDFFDERRTERVRSSDLIEWLCEDDEKPWATYNRGKPITARQMSKKLSGYGIKTNKTIRFNSDSFKGYKREFFLEAWSRYIPPKTQDSSVTIGHAVTTQYPCGFQRDRNKDATDGIGHNSINSIVTVEVD